MNPKETLTLSAASLTLFLVSCGDDETEGTAEQSGGESETLTPFVVADAHSDIKQISEVFADPKPGTKVVTGGEVMGRMNPFVKGRAMLVLGDPTKITPCSRIPGDECPTPWDVCCDLPEVIKKSIATIQFVDEDGKIIPTGLKGFKGIKEMTYLTVSGTIAEGSNADNLLITASEVYVADESPYKDAKPVSGHEPEETGDEEKEKPADEKKE
ncbi:MAG: hypothetical protein HKN23_14555 [Verrucomicrobiales bacterium]|nr:hypothetical protein [Verrucomicrobiales bacterium]